MKRSPMKRGTKRLPAQSARRVAEADARAACRTAVLERAGGVCEYADVIPEVTCGPIGRRRELEVDEIRGGSYRCTDYLDPEQCRASCARHHDWKTVHKATVLDRLVAANLWEPTS